VIWNALYRESPEATASSCDQDPKTLNQTAKNPNRLNPNHLKTFTTQ